MRLFGHHITQKYIPQNIEKGKMSFWRPILVIITIEIGLKLFSLKSFSTIKGVFFESILKTGLSGNYYRNGSPIKTQYHKVQYFLA